MTDIISVILGTLSGDPPIFYLFIGIMAAAVASLFFYRLIVGAVGGLVLSLILLYSGFFLPWIYAPSIFFAVFIFIYVLKATPVNRKIRNFINWIYLYYRINSFKSKRR
ncbi:hypothetical protein M1293_01740 [Candidatus Parvarchaeota archaeon]|nr:hypothetical protein [Candidatus Parvarchaeota archaeon]